MARYIDAGMAIEMIESDCLEQVYYSKQDAIDCIECIPSADVMKVVRCKDCKHYTDNINDDNLRNGFCERLKNYYFDTHKPTDYCSFGERKSDKPKLTKAEHSFCEIIQEGYIARDASGDIYYCLSEPEKQCIAWEVYNWAPVLLSSCSFPFITWEDSEAWSIEDLLELKAEE